MKHTKKLTVSAMAVALGVAVLLIGSYLELMELTVAVFASLMVVFIYIEIGSPYTFLVWLATAALTAVFNFASTVWLSYLLLFGLYPIAKGYIERLPRPLWLPLRLVFVNVMLVGCICLANFIIGVPFFGEMESVFGLPTEAVFAGLIILMNAAFLLYDVMIGVMVRFYMERIRPKLRSILK